MPNASSSLIKIYSEDISVPANLLKNILSPTDKADFCCTPFDKIFPGPTAITVPIWGFSFAASGMKIPPIVFSSASIIRFIKMI